MTTSRRAAGTPGPAADAPGSATAAAGAGAGAAGAGAAAAGGEAAGAAVWASGLRKRYRKRQAVDGVTFTVGRGEVVGLLGPNGAGKTTVIKMLLGLVRPDAGEVMLLGRPGPDPRSRARVGYLPELFRYQPWLTAAEVLRLHARLAGVATDLEPLGLTGLADRADDRVGGFSKGMQQRLGLAVALIARPELVVLDEPTSALDPLGRADVRDLLLTLRAQGVAVLLNSHLIGEVERVCDRVVILDHGRVAASGSLAEMLGQHELRLGLSDLSDSALERLGPFTRDGDVFVVRGDVDTPGLVADLVRLGVRIHSVEPARISLEERLLDIIRSGS
ncbi:ABC transporter ATP-binding protein [Paractinoplanes abujensis]|uniref:ABC-2 type transport system ATP-binding protein n=1 Tax=Paractinoplanes abujensis TaxID=882441 RepID=A0A7W7G3F6_9ACTN|nr:ABC transporter ATP-binding protein [Actinoplanes abujensis]MBB4694150.1 ABC-2 type transport system ATP-binding protein [Actinoplanes abujensis]GID20636.1 ABC transporter ATP-binding protein [Actinoplanes abujensis]